MTRIVSGIHLGTYAKNPQEETPLAFVSNLILHYTTVFSFCALVLPVFLSFLKLRWRAGFV